MPVKSNSLEARDPHAELRRSLPTAPYMGCGCRIAPREDRPIRNIRNLSFRSREGYMQRVNAMRDVPDCSGDTEQAITNQLSQSDAILALVMIDSSLNLRWFLTVSHHCPETISRLFTGPRFCSTLHDKLGISTRTE